MQNRTFSLAAEAALTKTWRGDAIPPEEFVHMSWRMNGELLTLEVAAPYYGDPTPPTASGRCERLWEYEVVEFFWVGPDERYLEIELGPHGHYLALQLQGVRNIVHDQIPVEFQAEITGARWRGRAQVKDWAWSQPLVSWNAFAIHGVEPRHYLAHHPVGGERPDFHRLDQFPRWDPVKVRT